MGSDMSEKAVIMDSDAMQRAVARMAYEIIEKNKGAGSVALVGVQRRGVSIARRIAKKIEEVEGVALPLGILDITFYRDDLSILAEHPVINGTDIGFSITGRNIILVDDVLYTGRTVRAAIDSLMDLGRAKTIQLAILIDRGHRELPIRADYVGKDVPTSNDESVHVSVSEIDGMDRVTIY